MTSPRFSEPMKRAVRSLASREGWYPMPDFQRAGEFTDRPERVDERTMTALIAKGVFVECGRYIGLTSRKGRALAQKLVVSA